MNQRLQNKAIVKKLFLVYNFLLLTNVIYTQSVLSHIERSDSIFFKVNFLGHPLKLKNGFGIIDTDSLILYRFSNDLRFLDSIQFHFPEKFNPVINSKSIFVTEESIVLMTIDRYKLLFFDKQGNFKKAVRLKPKFGKRQYFIPNNMNLVSRQFNSIYQSEVKSFLIEIEPFVKVKKTGIDSSLRKKYHTKGLVGEFDERGKLINVYGHYEKPYTENSSLSYLDNCHFANYFDAGIIYTCSLSDKLYIEKYDSPRSEPVGQRGKFFNLPEQGFKGPDEPEDMIPYYSRLIESPFNISLVTAGNYIVRIYTSGIEDSVQVDPKDIELREKWLKGEIKGCWLQSKSEEKKLDLLSSKPRFIQIYDSKSLDLLFDGPIDLRWPYLLGAKDDKLFFLGGLKPLKIYKYKLVNPQR